MAVHRLKIYSNNVNGFNSPNKRKKIWHHIKKGKYDLICLQETHIVHKHGANLIQNGLGNMYYASDSVKKRGVVTYVNNKIVSEISFKDSEGRVLGVTLKIGDRRILLCNIYAPNGCKTKFVSNLYQKILEHEYEDLIIVGDFNGVVDAELDRSNIKGTPKKGGSGKLPPSFIQMKEDLGLQDIWRHRHSRERDYTFLSQRHLTWSRIDMVWGTKLIASQVASIRILPRLYSDHAPIEIILEEKRHSKGEYRWRLNDMLLKEPMDQNRYRKALTEYFQLNNEKDSDINSIWDASKAYIRGHFIQQNIRKNRDKRDKQKDLEGRITALEEKIKTNPSDKESTFKLEAVKKQVESLQLEEIGKKMTYIRQQNFENANKIGKWLARKINKRKHQQYIDKIQEGNNTYLEWKEIENQFVTYYRKLYTEDNISREKVMQYLGRQNIKKISESQRECLNKKIEIEEIEKAIQRLPPNKAPGPDGLTSIYYKTFHDILCSPLQKVMNRILEGGNVPQTWENANIVLIPKKNTDNVKVANYRPISLTNVDYKIFSSILADRLKNVLFERIHEDQCGFLPGRQQKENIRVLLNAIEYYEKNRQKEVAFLFLDAEKAFDSVNWFCMFEILAEMDIGFFFKNAIKKIYSQQRARIIINGQLSDTIEVEKGTRQGCPLSPLLFILTAEILLEAIRKREDLKGLRTKNNSFKIRAYADDIVCIIEDPLNQIMAWMEAIESFGEVAGIKINRDKTKILTKNMSQTQKAAIQIKTGIEVVKKIKYLGIEFTASNTQLEKNNYDKKWREIKKKLKRWESLPISLLGKIAIIKMKVLAEILFLFQNLPILKNRKSLGEWQRETNKFIWGRKRARIKFQYMKDDTQRGGLGVPDFQLYYDAAALEWVKDWATLKKTRLLALEGQDLNKGWHAYIWKREGFKERNFNNHYLRKALLLIWEKYKSRFLSRTPLWLSPLELEHKREIPKERWLTYKQLLKIDNSGIQLKPFEEIKQIEPSITWLNYWQIRERFKADNQIGFERSNTVWDKVLKLETRTIKMLYQQLLIWETEEVHVKENMITWERYWQKKIKYTYSTMLKESWYKIFYRWYITPAKLAKFNKGKSGDECWKCRKSKGDLYHMWWGCKKIKGFWRSIQKEMEIIFQRKFVLKPAYFLLGLTDFFKDLNNEKLFIYMISAARLVIAKKWKTPEVPSLEQWILKLMDIQNMDILTQIISQNTHKGIKTDWSKLCTYLKEKRNLDT
uniref:Reverse transcriptase domain-containing protein n=1 Tax=Anolis carolinensis TaxID=28377 RepID=A0A803SS30_ANOCA